MRRQTYAQTTTLWPRNCLIQTLKGHRKDDTSRRFLVAMWYLRRLSVDALCVESDTMDRQQIDHGETRVGRRRCAVARGMRTAMSSAPRRYLVVHGRPPAVEAPTTTRLLQTPP
jgi:hypothetical protein